MVSVQELFLTIKAGDAERLEEILEDEPHLASARDASGLSAVLWATYHSQLELVDALLEAGAELDGYDAAAVGDTGRLTELMEQDSGFVRGYSVDGWTALHLAAFFGHADATALLAGEGADIEAMSRNATANRPLHAAVAAGRMDVTGVLLAKGADVNGRTATGLTPLMIAAGNGSVALVDRLMHSGAEPALRDAEGRTAADLARQRDHAQIAARIEPGAGRVE